ncbi:MAG: hypothetical protein R6W94_01460 [Spirochaetia bacterium]
MQGAGGPGSIARLIFEAGAQRRSSLRSGQVVRANVIKQLAPSKWMLGIGGRVIAATSQRSLSPGMTFQAQVRIEGGTVLLQPYEQIGAQEGALRFLGAEGLPRDELSVTILRALLRSGMPLDPGHIRNVYTFFKNRESVSPRMVRAYLLMQQKGLSPSEEGLDRFIDALDGYGGRRDGAGDGGAHGGAHDDAERRRGQRERGRARETKGEDAVREVMGRREEEADDLIHAFNHLRGEGGHWIVVPFSVDAGDGQSYHGSIRVHFSGNRPTFDRAAVSAEGKRGRWEFELVRRGGESGGGAGAQPSDRAGGGTRVFYPGGEAPPADLLGELTERLGPLGFGGVDAVPEGDFDGFSTGESVDILRGIDTEA